MPFINSLEGQILTVGSEIIKRWLTYLEGSFNNENTRKQIESGLATEGPIDIFNENEVSEQLGKMGLDKATGSDDLSCSFFIIRQPLCPVVGRKPQHVVSK